MHSGNPETLDGWRARDGLAHDCIERMDAIANGSSVPTLQPDGSIAFTADHHAYWEATDDEIQRALRERIERRARYE